MVNIMQNVQVCHERVYLQCERGQRGVREADCLREKRLQSIRPAPDAAEW